MNLETTQNITLDLTIPRIKNVRCVENDSQSRIIHILVTNNGEAYPLDSSMEVNYKIHKPDHTYVYNENPIPINPDGTVTITIPDQAMAVHGVAYSELQIFDGASKNIISTMPFNIIIEKSVIGNKDIESKNESDVINGMIKHLVDYDNPHKMPDATTKIKGITKLTDSINNSSTDTAATPNSVKQTYDALTAETARAKSAEQTISDTISRNKPDWDDAADKKHVHANKSVLDGISSALVSDWNDAAARDRVIIGSVTPYKVSNSLKKYGIDQNNTLQDAYNALPSPSLTFIHCNGFNSNWGDASLPPEGFFLLYKHTQSDNIYGGGLDEPYGSGFAEFHSYFDCNIYVAHVTYVNIGTTNYWEIGHWVNISDNITPEKIGALAVNGTAKTAKSLAENRGIFGHSFDGTKDIEGKGIFYGTYTQNPVVRFNTCALEIRENDLVGSQQSDIGYAPSIGFHWSNRIAGTIAFGSDGKYYFLEQDGTSKATVAANLEGNVSLDSDAYPGLLTDHLPNFYQPRGKNGYFTGNIDELYNMNQMGSYWLHPTYSTGTKPTNSWHDLLVFPAADNAAVQLAIPFKGDNVQTDMYMRSRVNNRWSVWRNLSDGGHAVMADSDGDGNNIANTYVKKGDVPIIQRGSESISTTVTNTWIAKTVRFSSVFSKTPTVVVSKRWVSGMGVMDVTAYAVNTEEFSIFFKVDKAINTVVDWIAVSN